MATEKLTLFIPPVHPDEVIWSGLPESKEEALAKYDVDQVLYTNEVNASLAAYGRTKTTTVYAIPEQVSEHITFLAFAGTNLDSLRTAIDECRVVKDAYEVALIRKANQISTIPHIEAQKAARNAQNEEQLYGAFIGKTITVANKTPLHYDETLRTAGPVNHYEIVNWFEDNLSRDAVGGPETFWW